MRKLFYLLLMVVIMLPFSVTAAVPSANAATPCVGATAQPFHHVVVLMFENKTYSQVIGSTSAPYITGLANKCGTYSNWHDANFKVDGTTDGNYVSKPNYSVLTDGVPPSQSGLLDDTYATQSNVDNIYHQLSLTSLTFKDYYNAAAGGCGVRFSGDYHDPIRYYTDVASICNAHDVPLSTFQTDVNNGNLPAFSVLLPTNSQNMHDNSIASGDAFAQTVLDPLMNSSAYAAGDVAIFFLWDEDTPIPNVLIAPSIIAGSKVPTPAGNPISHYSAMLTFEQMLGLPVIGVSGQAPSLLPFFNGQAVAATNTPTQTATVTRTPTATVSGPTVTPSATPAGSLTLPLRLVFYYPWFPEAWTQGGVFPFTQYHPTLGFYDSSDVSVIQNHIAVMQYANFQGAIASWWGQGTRTDGRISTLLSTANGTGFKWTLYYEPEGQGNPTSAQIASDLSYIVSRYASNANYLHIAGRPVIFVYGDGTDNCTMVDRWRTANTFGFYVVLKVFSGYTTCASQPDNWHQYAPAVAFDHQGTHSYAVSPGFFKSGETTPRLVRDPNIFATNVRNMLASGSNFQLVTTFNEWGEGTSVESATEWNNTYLDILHNNGQLVPTLTPSPPSSPTASATSTSTVTPTSTSTFTSTPTPTATVTPSNTPTNTATATSTSTATDTPTSTPTSTPAPVCEKVYEDANLYMLVCHKGAVVPTPTPTNTPFASAGGAVYYVDSSGNDNNPGTQSAPFQTLVRGTDALLPGDTLIVSGTYSNQQFDILKSGTADHRIKIIGQGAVVDGSPNFGIYLAADYVDLSGFTITHAYAHGLWDKGQHNTITNNIVRNNVTENGNNDVCGTSTFGWGSGISIKVGSNDTLVQGNQSYDNCGEGIAVTRGVFATVIDNVSHDNYSVNIYVDNSHDVTVRGNRVTCTDLNPRDGRRGTGIADGAETYTGWGYQRYNNYFYSNTVDGCWDGIALWSSSLAGTTDTMLIDGNHIMTGTRRSISIGSTNNQNVVVSNNCVFAPPVVIDPTGVTLTNNMAC